MKCEEYQSLIEAYFDGELDHSTAGLVSIHLESCRACSSEFEQLGLEQRVYGSYERGLSTAPELWSNVRDRIIQDIEPAAPRERWQQRWQIVCATLFAPRFSAPVSAALLLVAVAATVAVVRYLDRKQSTNLIAVATSGSAAQKPIASESNRENKSKAGETDVRVKAPKLGSHNLTAERRAAVSKADLGAATPSQLVRAAEKNYLSAIAMLTRDVEKRPSQLDPETRTKLDQALVSVDRTISATRKAVRKDPNDPLIVHYMLTAYAKKVDLLKEMTSY